MARGWESKDVEEQIASRATDSSRDPARKALTPEQQALQRERDSLLLSRTRVLHDLASATNPRYRELLERSLAFLDEKLSQTSVS